MKELTDFLDKYNQKYEIVGDKVVGGDIFLYNKNLTTLPESFGNLKCNKLWLSCNKLTYLPESFGNLKCNKLWLSYNNLTYLPILNENITNLSIDNFDDLTNLLYLQNLIYLCINKIGFYVNDSLTEILNKIRHQKVMNNINKILQTL